MKKTISKAKEQRIRKHAWIKITDEIDILEMLKQQNANKKKLIDALDRDLQQMKERKASK